MATETITIQLPAPVLRRAQEAARTLRYPVEDVLSRTLTAAFSDAEAPAEMQAELTRMAWLSDQDLWNIARAEMTRERQARMSRLAEIQTERNLDRAEVEQLEALRLEYVRTTLRKAHAYTLLSMRGGESLLAQV